MFWGVHELGVLGVKVIRMFSIVEFFEKVFWRRFFRWDLFLEGDLWFVFWGVFRFLGCFK